MRPYGASSGIDEVLTAAWEPGVAGYAMALGAGDVNGDGYADLVVASRGGTREGERSGVVRVYAGSPGRWSPARRWPR